MATTTPDVATSKPVTISWTLRLNAFLGSLSLFLLAIPTDTATEPMVSITKLLSPNGQHILGAALGVVALVNSAIRIWKTSLPIAGTELAKAAAVVQATALAMPPGSSAQHLAVVVSAMDGKVPTPPTAANLVAQTTK